jgi:hypothetical protein
MIITYVDGRMNESSSVIPIINDDETDMILPRAKALPR